MFTHEFVFDHLNFNTLPSKLERFLGGDFVNTLDLYDTVGMKEYESRRLDKRSHTLCKYWRSLKQAIKQTEEKGKLSLNENAIFLLNLYFTFEICKNVKNFERILRTLKIDREFFSSCHELDVARYYVELGYKVEAIPETTQKTPDFKVTTNEGDIVYVEAKQLDNLKQKEDVKWQQLIKNIDSILVKYKKSLQIHIIATETFDKINQNEILRILEEYCEKYFNKGNCKATNDYVTLEISKICDWEQEGIEEVPISDLGDINVTNCIFKNTGMRNLRAISVTKFTKLDIQKTIRNNIQKASKQATNGHPLIIHVGLPNKKSKELLTISDYVQKQVLGDVNRNFEKVNAVILSGSFIEKNSKEANPARDFRIIIPNFNSKFEIPKTFRFNSGKELNIETILEQGSVSFTYDAEDIQKNLKSEMFSDLGFFCSHDAKNQFRLHITNHEMLRLQIISPNFTYRNFDIPVSEEDFLKGNKLRVVWTKDSSTVFINDVKFESKLIR